MSRWSAYVGEGLPRPGEVDRARIERLAGTALPDAYWQLVQQHQGDTLEEATIVLDGQGELGFGVLLIALSPAHAGEDASYTVERCFANMKDYYPAGIIPFADDTGGNYWAFDLRRGGTTPAILFVDHEVEGDEGLTPAAPSFETFLAAMGAGS